MSPHGRELHFRACYCRSTASTSTSMCTGRSQEASGTICPKKLRKPLPKPFTDLLRRTGEIGQLYDAKTSPQMVVINPQGIVIYDGAIDDKPTADLNDIVGATNYVNLAL